MLSCVNEPFNEFGIINLMLSEGDNVVISDGILMLFTLPNKNIYSLFIHVYGNCCSFDFD